MLGILSEAFGIATRQDAWSPPAAMRSHDSERRHHEERKQKELRLQRQHAARRFHL